MSFPMIHTLTKVKAHKDSPNLARLQQASKGVTQATAGVVASTKSGKSQIEETGECLHLFTLVVGEAEVFFPHSLCSYFTVY